MKYCCFENCKTDARYHKDRLFYPVPKPGKNLANLENCRKWVKAINRENITVETIKAHHHVCNLHFIDGRGPSLENPYPAAIVSKSCKIENIRVPFSEFKLNKTNCTNYSRIPDQAMEKKNILLPDDVMNKSLELQQSKEVICLNMETEQIMEDFGTLQAQTQSACPSQPVPRNTHEAPEASVSPDMNSIEAITLEKLSEKIKTHQENNKTSFEWIISSEIDKLILLKRHNTVRIEIDVNMVLSVIVFEKIFDKSHEIYPNQSTCVKTFEGLLYLLTRFDKYLNVCPGVSGRNFEPYFNEKHKIASYFPESNSLRSNSCQLMKRKSLSWCPKCFLIQRALLQRIKRKSRNVTSPKTTNLRNLSLEEIRRRLTSRKQKNKALVRANKALKQRIENLIQKNGIELTSEESEDMKNIIEDNPFETPSKYGRFFLLQQLKLINSKTSRPSKWHPAIIHWCLYLKSKSASTYEALRQVFTLPTRRRLYNYSKNLRAESGFHPETIKELKEEIKFDTLKEHQKNISIMIDEMAIKRDLIYRVSTGEIVGLTNSNDSQNKIKNLMKNIEDNTEETTELATHVMQIMIRGLSTNFKYPFAYFPCDKMKADELYSILWEAVENLQLGGFKVLTIVCDKAGINQKLIKMCCGDEENPSKVGYKTKNLFAKGEFIYFVSDVPHLIKTIRNGLESSGNCKNTRLLKKNGKHLLWSHVEEVFKKDSELESGLKLASKIKYDHIYLTSFSRMKVNYAAQVLSKTMASSMKMLVGDKASETITFIEMVNNFFDAVNVRNLTNGKHHRNSFQDPYRSINDWRFKVNISPSTKKLSIR